MESDAESDPLKIMAAANGDINFISTGLYAIESHDVGRVINQRNDSTGAIRRRAGVDPRRSRIQAVAGLELIRPVCHGLAVDVKVAAGERYLPDGKR